MPRDNSIKKVLIIGSGPIVIGQACEFDYSGTQACKALMKEGLEVVLVNSNPATIMTDPEIATRVYIEPIKFEYLVKIIEKEKPDAIIPTLGGQTALNSALELHAKGVLEKYNVKLLGAIPEVIKAGEDREIFRGILDKIGAKYPKSIMVRTYDQAVEASNQLGLPLILRPNYTLGGGGGGVAYSHEEYKRMVTLALAESPTSEVLVEESIIGWKEFELEVMRDKNGTFVVVCSIENLDPCGVHTGDSITVAPQQTLSDQQYQAMRDEACLIINEVGIQTGGANIQFAVHPETGERVVIEMNPRVSRSSALASKATGFPIAKIAALLAVGYTLDEIQNDVTKVTPSCYEPALDYVVTKVPRFAFEKFAGAKDSLTTAMKSVGEVMAIGRTFKESLMKALLSLENNNQGIPEVVYDENKVSYPNSSRIYYLFQGFRDGKTLGDIQKTSLITPWFLEQIRDIVDFEKVISEKLLVNNNVNLDILSKSKRFGFSDARIAALCGLQEKNIEEFRKKNKIHPAFLQVDTCAGEFQSSTPYFYSTYWSQEESLLNFKNPVVVIGSGPNRIGQGIEFDYSCVRGVKALQKNNFKVAMINSNPETVSTDYDTSDILFFEPLTSEHVLEVMKYLNPKGFISQLGGQTPINMSKKLVSEGYQLLGSDIESIDLAEDRAQFSKICKSLDFVIPRSGMASNLEQAISLEKEIGYPMICRPSYVLGGRRMEVVENQTELFSYFERHGQFINEENQCLMDQFLEGALEVDVDLVRGGDWCVIGGIVEHIEAAGVHSGDSMGVVPPQRLKDNTCARIEEMSVKLANRINVIGHLNLQLAIKEDVIYMLEANPRSSRSVPFLAKATQIPLIDLGVAAMLGKKKGEIDIINLKELKTDIQSELWRKLKLVAVKGVVFPFKKFPEADAILGPEMKSTGESMGRGEDYSDALAKAFLSSNVKMPLSGEVFFSLKEKDKPKLLPLVKELVKFGYSLSATSGTAEFLNAEGIECLSLKKVHEGRPHCVDHIRSGGVAFVVNTTAGKHAIEASFDIRRACIDYGIPCLTESDAAEAFLLALKSTRKNNINVECL